MSVRRRIFIAATAILLFSFFLHAENLSKHVFTKTTPDGTVVFVKPHKIKRDGTTQALKDMECDIVLTTFSDTVTFTVSLITPQPISFDSVEVSVGNFNSYFPVEKLYIEPIGDNWSSRVRFYTPVSDFTRLYNTSGILRFKWGYNDTAPSYILNDKDWNKRRQVYRFAFDVISHNKH